MFTGREGRGVIGAARVLVARFASLGPGRATHWCGLTDVAQPFFQKLHLDLLRNHSLTPPHSSHRETRAALLAGASIPILTRPVR